MFQMNKIHAIRNIGKLEIICILIFHITSSFAANEINYRLDIEFFKHKLPIYEEWLNATGLGQVLKVHDIDVKKESVNVMLAFHYTDPDSIIVAWKQLKNDFEKENVFTLEQRLFYKMTHIIEVPPENIKITVKDNYNPGVDRYLYGNIYIKNGIVKSTIGPYRTVSKEITINQFMLNKNIFKTAVDIENKRWLEDEKRINIYDFIEDEVKKYFDMKGGDYSRFEKETMLTFQVMNIKHEVIKPGRLNIFDPHELLTFTLTYKPNENGITIFLVIDGKCGSALFKPRSLAAYWEMEQDYKSDLEAYTYTFGEKIRDWLSKVDE